MGRVRRHGGGRRGGGNGILWAVPIHRCAPTLDVTDPASIAAAAAAARDVTLVVNNAGGANGATVLKDSPALRDLFEVNFFGPLAVAHAFAPALAANGGGALVNVLSVLSWIGVGDGYSATKAALWSATNTQRLSLASESGTMRGSSQARGVRAVA